MERIRDQTGTKYGRGRLGLRDAVALVAVKTLNDGYDLRPGRDDAVVGSL